MLTIIANQNPFSSPSARYLAKMQLLLREIRYLSTQFYHSIICPEDSYYTPLKDERILNGSKHFLLLAGKMLVFLTVFKIFTSLCFFRPVFYVPIKLPVQFPHFIRSLHGMTVHKSVTKFTLECDRKSNCNQSLWN